MTRQWGPQRRPAGFATASTGATRRPEPRRVEHERRALPTVATACRSAPDLLSRIPRGGRDDVVRTSPAPRAGRPARHPLVLVPRLRTGKRASGRRCAGLDTGCSPVRRHLAGCDPARSRPAGRHDEERAPGGRVGRADSARLFGGALRSCERTLSRGAVPGWPARGRGRRRCGPGSARGLRPRGLRDPRAVALRWRRRRTPGQFGAFRTRSIHSLPGTSRSRATTTQSGLGARERLEAP